MLDLITFSPPRLFPELNDGVLMPLLLAILVIGYLMITHPPKRGDQ